MANAKEIIVQERLRRLNEKKRCKRTLPVHDLEDIDKLKEWVKDSILPAKTKPGKKPKKFPSAAKVLGLEEAVGGIFHYLTNCTQSTAEKIHALQDSGEQVDAEEFFAHVPLSEIFESGIGGIYSWTDEELAEAGVDPDDYGYSVEQNEGGLRLADDWAVGFYKGIYDGRPVYFMDHSRIEYIFA